MGLKDTSDMIASNQRGAGRGAFAVGTGSGVDEETPILSLGQSQNFAILFLLGVAFIIVVLLNFLALAFEISAFPFLEILGVIALLMLVIWSRMKALAAVAVLIFASTVMAPALFRETYTVLIGGLGLQAESAAIAEEASSLRISADPKEDADALADVDRTHLLETTRVLNAVAAATDIDIHGPNDPYPARDVSDTRLQLLAGIARSGFAQAEVLRFSTAFLVETDMIDCTSQDGFENRASTESRRMALALEMLSCRASVDGLNVAYRAEIANERAFTPPLAAMPDGVEAAFVSAGPSWMSWLEWPVTMGTAEIGPIDLTLSMGRDGSAQTLSGRAETGAQAAIRLSVPASASYSIRVRSENGDPFIGLYLEAGDQLLKLDENDDYNGYDSGLDVFLDVDSSYVLIVREYNQDSMNFSALLGPLQAARPQDSAF